MKRTLLAGTFYLLAGAAVLVLAASIFYSCRKGGDPHHERSSRSHDTPQEETHADMTPQRETDGLKLTVAEAAPAERGGIDPADAQ